MKILHYSDQHVLTGDEIASAVLDYAKALALMNRSDVVPVPALDGDQAVSAYELLIGPASEIVASDADPLPVEELINSEFLDEIRRRIEALSDHSHPVDDAAYLNSP